MAQKFLRKILLFYCSSVDDVDLFVGGLLEDKPTGTVGPTFRCLIGRQFQLYKTGDRFWYERKDGNIGFEKGR